MSNDIEIIVCLNHKGFRNLITNSHHNSTKDVFHHHESFSLNDQYITSGGDIIGSRYTRNTPSIYTETNKLRAPKQEQTIPLINGGIKISPGEIITANSDVIVGKPGVIGYRTKVSAPTAEIDSKNEINNAHLKSKSMTISKYQHDLMNRTKNVNRLLVQKNILLNYVPNIKGPAKIISDSQIQSNQKEFNYGHRNFFHLGGQSSTSDASEGYWKKPLNQSKSIIYPGNQNIHYPYVIPKKNYQKRILNEPLPNRFSNQFEVYTLPKLPKPIGELDNLRKKQNLHVGNYNIEIERVPEIFNTVLFNDDSSLSKSQESHYNMKKNVHNSDVLVHIKPSEVTDILIKNPDFCNKKNIFDIESDTRDLFTSATMKEKKNQSHPKNNNLQFHKNQKQFINLKTNTLNHQINVNVPPIQFKNYDDYDDPSEIGYLNNSNNTPPVRAQIQFDHILNDHFNENLNYSSKTENGFQLIYPQNKNTGQSTKYQNFNQQKNYKKTPTHLQQGEFPKFSAQNQLPALFIQPNNVSKLPEHLRNSPQFEYYINENPEKLIEPFISVTTSKYFDLPKNSENFNHHINLLHSDKHIEQKKYFNGNLDRLTINLETKGPLSIIPLKQIENANDNKSDKFSRKRCDPKLKIVNKNQPYNNRAELFQETDLLIVTPSHEYFGKRVLPTKSSEIIITTKTSRLAQQNLHPEVTEINFKHEAPYNKAALPTTINPYNLAFQYLNNNYRLTRTAPNLFRQNYINSVTDSSGPFIIEKIIQSSTQKYNYQHSQQHKLLQENESHKLKKSNQSNNIRNNTLKEVSTQTLPIHLILRSKSPSHPILIPISENILNDSVSRFSELKETTDKNISNAILENCEIRNLTKSSSLNNEVQIPLQTSKIESVLKPPKITNNYNTDFNFLPKQEGLLITPTTINSFHYYQNHSLKIPSSDLNAPTLSKDQIKFIIGLNPPPPPTVFPSLLSHGHKQRDQHVLGTAIVIDNVRHHIKLKDNENLNQTSLFKITTNFVTDTYNRNDSKKMPQQREKYLSIAKNEPVMSTIISIGNNVSYAKKNNITEKAPALTNDSLANIATSKPKSTVFPKPVDKRKITLLQHGTKSNNIHKIENTTVNQTPELLVEPAYYINELESTKYSVSTAHTSDLFSNISYSTIPLKFTQTTTPTNSFKNQTKILKINQGVPNNLKQNRFKQQRYQIKTNNKISHKLNESQQILETILPTKITSKTHSLINIKNLMSGAHKQNQIKSKNYLNPIRKNTKQSSHIILQTSKEEIHSQTIPNDLATKSIDYNTSSYLKNYKYKSSTKGLSAKHITKPLNGNDNEVQPTIYNNIETSIVEMTLTNSLHDTIVESQLVTPIKSTKINSFVSKPETLETELNFNFTSNFRNSKFDNFHSMLLETIDEYHSSLLNTTIRPDNIDSESGKKSEIELESKLFSKTSGSNQSTEDLLSKLIVEYTDLQKMGSNHKTSQIDNKQIDIKQPNQLQNPSIKISKNSSQIQIAEMNNDSDSIFVVISDSKSNNIPSLNSSVMNPQHNINSIAAAIGIDYNQYDDDEDDIRGEISTLGVPKRDEETQIKNENHILLGGILIAASPNVVTNYEGSTLYENKCKPECKSVKNEICRKIGMHMECVCRPGFARMFLDRSCKPTYTYTLRLPLHRNGNKILQFSDKLNTPGNQEFIKISEMSQDSLNRMVMQSDLRDIYHGVHIIGFERPNNNDGIIAEFYFQLSDRTDDQILKNIFKKYLQTNNFSIGGTDLYTTGSGVNELQIFDYNECLNSKLHDCSENSDCQNLVGTYTCSCRDGFVDISENYIYPGRLCSGEQPGCEKCHYHGRCYMPQKNLNNYQNSEQIVCKCFRWYAGSQCQLNLKLLLTTLLIFTAFILLILLICIILTCTRKRFHRRQNMALLASGINVIASGDSGKSNNIENSVSDASSQNSLILLSHEPAVTKVQHKILKKDDIKKKKNIVTNSKQKNQLSKQKKITHISLKQRNLESTDSGHRKLYNEGDRSPSVMIPRAKYRPPAIQNLKRKNAERLLTFLYTGGSFVQPTSTIQKPDQQIKRTFSQSSSKYGTVHATSTGALISAGFEVSANVSPVELQNQNIDKLTQQKRTDAISTNSHINLQQIIDIHPNYSDEGYEVQPRRNSFIHSVEDWFHTVKQQKQFLQRSDLTTFEARSFSEATVQPQTRVLIQNKTFNSQEKNLTNDDANTMAERDIGSTFLLPHTHLYKPDRGSDISGIDSF